MHRVDDSKFLLFLEFKKELKSAEPINDELTSVMALAISEAQTGTADYDGQDDEHFDVGGGWRGVHRTDCGAVSSNCEYLLKNGMITNSLATYYLQYYREHIPESEMDKVRELAAFYDKSNALAKAVPLSYGLECDQSGIWTVAEVTAFDEKNREPLTWAVRNGYRSAMSKLDGEFQHEPMPSNRDEEYFKEFRFQSADEAAECWAKFHGK